MAVLAKLSGFIILNIQGLNKNIETPKGKTLNCISHRNTMCVQLPSYCYWFGSTTCSVQQWMKFKWMKFIYAYILVLNLSSSMHFQQVFSYFCPTPVCLFGVYARIKTSTNFSSLQIHFLSSVLLTRTQIVPNISFKLCPSNLCTWKLTLSGCNRTF